MSEEKKVGSQGGALLDVLADTRSPAETHRSLVGQGITFSGKVTGRGDLVVRGTLTGEVHLEAHQVSIEEGGKVEANIQSENVVIRGDFKGTLMAKGLVKLDKTAHFEGELKAARLQMEDGATVKGSVKLQEA